MKVHLLLLSASVVEGQKARQSRVTALGPHPSADPIPESESKGLMNEKEIQSSCEEPF